MDLPRRATGRIPLSSPEITAADRRAVMRVLSGRHLSLGPEMAAFEREFARFVGTRHAVAVSSGTAALHLALLSSGVKPGDEVVTTPFSFVASANACLFVGARPVFVDIDPATLNIDPAKIPRALSRRTRAILAVHLFGLPCDMSPIAGIARRRRLVLIEDACEALGAAYRGRNAGAFGRAAAFAFYPNKQMTTGEGGMLVTSDARLAELARSFRNQGRDKACGWLSHVRVGYNYRLDEMSAALGRSQLARLPSILARRARVADAYRKLLGKIPGLGLLETPPGSRRSWFVYVVRLPEGVSRDRLQREMRRLGVDTRAYFPPIHRMRMYRALGYRAGQFPVTEQASRQTLALPFWTGMPLRQVRQVASALAAALSKRS